MHFQDMRRLISALMILAVMMGLAPRALAAVPAKVNSGSARAYAIPDTNAMSVKLKKNAKVKISAFSGSWAMVKYKGKAIYIKKDKLSPVMKSKCYAKKDAKIYNSAGDAVYTVSKGTKICLLGTIGDYYCVVNGSGDVGFMAAGTLTPVKSAKMSKADKVVAVAKGLLGARYAVNDNPPYSFNCSSFVKYCMNKAGISMKGTPYKQETDSRYKKITSISKLKKGDVLCFDGEIVDHTAIYIGGGKLIEASASAGKVRVNSLSDWYRRHFICARRPK